MFENIPPYVPGEHHEFATETPIEPSPIGEAALVNTVEVNNVAEQPALKNQRPDEVFGEWESVEPANRNWHQRIAAKTKGLATLANLTSVAGGVLTSAGIHRFAQGKRASGLAMAGAGRMADLADGVIAKRTGTRSKLGAAVDAGIDKALVAHGAIELTKSGAVPAHFAAVNGLQQVLIFAENTRIEKAGGKPNPSPDGKYGMAAVWAAFGARSAEKILQERGKDKAAKILGNVALVAETAALTLTEKAVSGYREQRRALPKQS